MVLGGNEPTVHLSDSAMDIKGEDYQRFSFWDMVSYLPDDILTKVDRASMAVNLEARVPILDHRVAQFAASLPLEMKVRGGQGKYLLRKLLYRYVPPALVERPKKGFGVPLQRWLKSELRDWCADLLAENRIKQQGLLEPEMVSNLWNQYLQGQANHARLWAILMFQAWHQEYLA
jgi:asparagine synthase (glutamine-hydrolysing)